MQFDSSSAYSRSFQGEAWSPRSRPLNPNLGGEAEAGTSSGPAPSFCVEEDSQRASSQPLYSRESSELSAFPALDPAA